MMLARGSEDTIKWVNLEEILDVAWPTDRDLVWSFRATLKLGDPFVPIQLNRVWQEGRAHYEIIDGFHRFEAAKAEHLAALLCQVVEKAESEARLEQGGVRKAFYWNDSA